MAHQETEILQELVRDALELLADVKGKFGLFEKQEYGKLIKRFENHNAISHQLHERLDNIDTSRVNKHA